MKLARQVGLKVVLNGQGADETLGGYRSYFMDYWVELLRTGRVMRARSEIAAFARATGQPSEPLFRTAVETSLRQALHHLPFYEALANRQRRAALPGKSWVAPELRKFWRPVERSPARTLNEVLHWSLERAHLPLYLRTEDRNSMAHGVELRLPFLDYRLVSLAFSLGSEWKIRGEYTKVLLREAMTGRIPDVVRTRVQKFGFPTAAAQWFRGALYEPLRDLLASRVVRESGLWNLAEVDRDLERHRRGEANLSGRLFDIAQLSLLASGVPRPSQATVVARPAEITSQVG
jgi:asparagine synthase (glutamine-hydrolysing)